MKFMVFGVLLHVMKECRKDGVSDQEIVGTLTKTIDPDSDYLNCDNGTISKLFSCTGNLSNGHQRIKGQSGRVKDGTFEPGYTTNRLSDVIGKARKANKAEVAKKIAEEFLPLLNEDRKALFIAATLGIIKEDKRIEGEYRLTFEKEMGCTKEQFLEQREFVLSELIAGLLLYCATAGKNTDGKTMIEEITPEYINSFASNTDAYSYIDARPEDEERVIPENYPDEKKVRAYLTKVNNKYNQIKTLLYTEEPKPFYSFYVCNDVWRQLGVKGITDSIVLRGERIENITAEKIAKCSKYAIITGTGGIGKSMMMRHLLLTAVKDYERTGLFPVFVTLKDYGDKVESLLDFVFERIDSFGTGLEKEEIIALLNAGKCLLLFDGADEINTRFIETFEKHLEDITDRFSDNQYIISSRPYKVMYNGFTRLNVMPLNKKQALKLIDKLEFRQDEPQIKLKFREELNKTLYLTHREFTENPLLLTIMLMTYEQFAEVPSKMHIFYREAYITLAQKHDASKGAYKRVLRTGLSAERFSDYFAEFCAKTYYDEKFELTEEEFARYFSKLKERNKENKVIAEEDFLFDLCTNMCLMYKENDKYLFTHRSFQEYFCALYFSRQKDSTLGAIGNFFEKQRCRNYSDKTFMMLYDMIPSKVEEYIFVPYLENLLTECDRMFGYWTFLKKIYRFICYSHGEPGEDEIMSPESYIYENIKTTFFNREINASSLPFEDSFVTRTYVYKEIGNDAVVIRDADDISFDYDYLKKYGEPEIAGYNLEFEIDDVLASPTDYKKILDALNADDFCLKKEYQAARDCLKMLKERQKPKGDDLFDLFN